MHLRPSLILLSLCVILISCSGASKGGLSPAEEKLFVEAYVKLTLAAQDHQGDPDGLATAQEVVFRGMGMDQERFAAWARKMEASPERWAAIWEQIVERLQEGRGEKGV